MENLKDRLTRAEEDIAHHRRELQKEEARGEEYASTGKYANVRNPTSNHSHVGLSHYDRRQCRLCHEKEKDSTS
jgi:hypothetical protein